MSRPVLIIITGPPAAGKTSLGHLLRKELGIPFFSKDRFKETFYENLLPAEYKLRELQHLGKLAFDALRVSSEQLAEAGISHILEGNFNAKLFSPFLQKLSALYPLAIYQVYLTAETQVLQQRFLDRIHRGNIHPVHQGEKYFSEISPQFNAPEPDYFAVEGLRYLIDTSLNMESAFTQLAEKLKTLLNPSI